MHGNYSVNRALISLHSLTKSSTSITIIIKQTANDEICKTKDMQCAQRTKPIRRNGKLMSTREENTHTHTNHLLGARELRGWGEMNKINERNERRRQRENDSSIESGSLFFFTQLSAFGWLAGLSRSYCTNKHTNGFGSLFCTKMELRFSYTHTSIWATTIMWV